MFEENEAYITGECSIFGDFDFKKQSNDKTEP
jgi:hypothetical protein